MRIKNVISQMFRLAESAIRFFFRHVELILVSALIFLAAVQYYLRPQSQSLDQVIASGELRVLIADEPDSQYMLNRQHFGFEYDMLSELANDLGVTLSLDVVPYGELFTLLSSGAGDIAVGGILDSPFVHRVSQPTIPWYQAKTTVIYKRGTQRPKNLKDLQGAEILAGARYYQLKELEALNLVDDYRSEYDLFAAVDMGEERFVLSTNYRALNAKHYMPYLNRSFILPEKVGVVWALPKRYDSALLERINLFLEGALERKLPNKLATSYFKSPNRLSTYDVLAIHRKIKTEFPEYEFAFRKAARRGRLDWQLLAAMAYQESRWSNEAKSPTGVRGIMQLTTETARSLGVDDRLDMSQSIDAAARYVRELKAQLPDDIKEPERTWFAIGAYNAGLKHIRNAYHEAKKRGLDNTKWRSVREVLPTLYGEPFSKGGQAKHYVDRVQIFTDIIRFYDLHQRDEVELKRGVAVIGELEPEE
ncbi:transglycosylase SLT domain-containing protein [Arenicella xantha]|uniref:Membrane-bound lytic murein transglycosylase F n=1 Tax=Arenicella xantha TaxID=644221 RepID=A0A395JFK4_9GAMM|nr:transglycosylase SLT domain-containing protein [Arenicella xantha]RBP48540.1 membrane-bound lytic murein transglycosylase F [Arenicella xantha]